MYQVLNARFKGNNITQIHIKVIDIYRTW